MGCFFVTYDLCKSKKEVAAYEAKILDAKLARKPKTENYITVVKFKAAVVRSRGPETRTSPITQYDAIKLFLGLLKSLLESLRISGGAEPTYIYGIVILA